MWQCLCCIPLKKNINGTNVTKYNTSGLCCFVTAGLDLCFRCLDFLFSKEFI